MQILSPQFFIEYFTGLQHTRFNHLVVSSQIILHFLMISL